MLVDVVGVVLYAVLADRNALLPTATEGRSGDEGVDLEGHVLFENVVGAGLHPRSLNLDHTGTVAGTVGVCVAVACIVELLEELLCDAAGNNACLQLLLGPVVHVKAELNVVAALALNILIIAGASCASTIR